MKKMKIKNEYKILNNKRSSAMSRFQVNRFIMIKIITSIKSDDFYSVFVAEGTHISSNDGMWIFNFNDFRPYETYEIRFHYNGLLVYHEIEIDMDQYVGQYDITIEVIDGQPEITQVCDRIV
jgi:hypothetical protein